MPVTSPARQIPPAQPIPPTPAKLGLPETPSVTADDPFPGSAPPQPAATQAVEREILGTIDIGFGLPENAWDQIPSAIPSAMAERPSWERRTALDQATPKARPGYVQRWVRIATADGRPDVSNKAEALMTGWRPRRAQTLADSEVGMPVYDPGDGKGGVMIFKEQLLLDITPEGLRIQIVDQQNRPMFDSGSFRLQSYTISILNELAPYLQGVPNRLSITGHTDTTPFGGGDSGYTNWELSADRANAARRALVTGGVSMEKMARVVGVSDSVLFDKDRKSVV
jgi:chemotaxis protein MotB